MLQDEQIWNPLIQSLSWEVDFGLKSLDVHLKSSNILLLSEREGLGLQGFSLSTEKVLIWEKERERPSLGNDFSYLVVSLKMKGVGVYL